MEKAKTETTPFFSAPCGLFRACLTEANYPLLFSNTWMRERLPADTALMDMLHPRMHERLRDAVRRAGEHGEISLELEVFGLKKQIRYLMLHGTVHDDCLDAAVLDITSRHRSEFWPIEPVCEAVHVATPVATFYINLTQDRLLDTDSVWCKSNLLKGDLTYSRLVHVCEKAMYPQYHQQVQEKLGRQPILRAFERGCRIVSCEYLGRSGEVKPAWYEATMNLWRDQNTGDICGLLHIQNVDKRKRQEQELRHCAERDELTGVLNRRATRAHIDRVLSEGAALERCDALLMIDLDDFKQINDTYGHVQGDSVLSGFAAHLRNIFRESDIIGRLGGDEFVILVRDIPRREAAIRKATQICCVMRSTNKTDEEVSGSVGIAFAPDDGTTFDELYYKADIALYRAKRRGKNRCAVYSMDLEHMENDPNNLSQ